MTLAITGAVVSGMAAVAALPSRYHGIRRRLMAIVGGSACQKIDSEERRPNPGHQSGLGSVWWFAGAAASSVAGAATPGVFGVVVGGTIAAVCAAVGVIVRPSPVDVAVVTWELSDIADLLAACLRAGTPPMDALIIVAQARDDPAGLLLRRWADALSLGVDPRASIDAHSPSHPWIEQLGALIGGRSVARSAEGLAAQSLLWRILVRSHDSGSAAAAALERFADDLRAERSRRGREIAGRLGVKSAGPLGLCFLPAFVLLGVVPVVTGLVATVPH
jgi:hypothetical protein